MLETKYPYVDAVFASPPPPSLCWLWFNKLMKPDCRFDLNAGSEMRRRRRSLQFCRDASNILPFAARHTSIFLILLRNKRMQWHSTTKYIPFVREFNLSHLWHHSDTYRCNSLQVFFLPCKRRQMMSSRLLSFFPSGSFVPFNPGPCVRRGGIGNWQDIPFLRSPEKSIQTEGGKIAVQSRGV